MTPYVNETEDGREMTHYCNEQQDSMVLDCGCEFRQSDCGQGGVDFLWCTKHGTRGDAAFEAMRNALRDAQALLDTGADTLADDRLGTEPHALMDTMTDAAMDCRAALAKADEVSK